MAEMACPTIMAKKQRRNALLLDAGYNGNRLLKTSTLYYATRQSMGASPF
jgi:hypothetical protein